MESGGAPIKCNTCLCDLHSNSDIYAFSGEDKKLVMFCKNCSSNLPNTKDGEKVNVCELCARFLDPLRIEIHEHKKTKYLYCYICKDTLDSDETSLWKRCCSCRCELSSETKVFRAFDRDTDRTFLLCGKCCENPPVEEWKGRTLELIVCSQCCLTLYYDAEVWENQKTGQLYCGGCADVNNVDVMKLNGREAKDAGVRMAHTRMMVPSSAPNRRNKKLTHTESKCIIN